MNITQRQVGLVLFGLIVVASFTIGAASLIQGALVQGAVGIASGSLFAALTLAYWRGIENVRYVGIIAIICFTAFGTEQRFVIETAPFANAIPPIMATLLAGPAWTIGSMASLHLILLFRAQFTGIYTTPVAIVISILVSLGLVLIRLITETALRAAETNAVRLAQSLEKARQQAAELAQQASELREQNEQQRRLIDLVATLETPAVALADGVLLAPIVGHLDSRRAQNLTARILQIVSEQRTRMVILDISGVSTVDTQVAHALLKAIQAIRLLGCDVTITGISASVATTITHLGISLAGVSTSRTPQDALANMISLNNRAKTAERAN